MWVTDLRLYLHDRDVLRCNTSWINDNIIYAAQFLLKEQSKEKCYGWQSTQCCKSKDLFPPIPPFPRFIQIIHVNENHWVTVSNIKVPGDEIFRESICIDDSLCSTSISNTAQKQICSFVRPQGKSLQFDLMNTQDSLNDCGLFAISYATELVYERDP